MNERHKRSAVLALALLHEFGFQAHGTDAGDFAVDVVIALNQADVLNLGADLNDRGRAFDLQVLDDRDGIAIL